LLLKLKTPSFLEDERAILPRYHLGSPVKAHSIRNLVLRPSDIGLTRAGLLSFGFLRHYTWRLHPLLAGEPLNPSAPFLSAALRFTTPGIFPEFQSL
jgi:hypothetical protein